MAIKDSFLQELEQESSLTRQMLERVPEGRLDWRPHEKSMTLGRLASHIAEIPGWSVVVLDQDEFDMAPADGPRYETEVLDSVAAILESFDRSVARTREVLRITGDEEFATDWTLKSAGTPVFSARKVDVMRGTLFNHSVHHRGQLSVYLRLLGVPLPAVYGPTADEGFGGA
jgi:uncharacterized damage-inducible protein DinB